MKYVAGDTVNGKLIVTIGRAWKDADGVPCKLVFTGPTDVREKDLHIAVGAVSHKLKNVRKDKQP